MNKRIAKSGCLAAAIALTLGLAACGKADDGKTAGQKLDGAIAATEQKAAEIKADVKDAAAEARADVKSMSSDAKARTEANTSTMGDKIDDAAITASVNAGIAKDSDLSAIKINVDTKDGAVTLMGPAPTTTAKDRATEIAKNVKGVKSVNNQLVVKS
ncbi:MAG: BON domain-containing protein [Comamonadaceae bacterium]|nr:MAG: BON domain-containing protein [Comamonadaceae bacterium]